MASSPSKTSFGRDSPVSALVSNVDTPLIIFPSRGIFSPGFTTMISSIFTSSGSTSSTPFSVFKFA